MAKKESDSGNLAEKKIIEFLNNKKTSDLEECNLKKLIIKICSDKKIENFNQKIICKEYDKKSTFNKGKPKADLEIIINQNKTYLSLKSGSSNSLHEEPKKNFLQFLGKFKNSNQHLTKLEEHLSKEIPIRNSEIHEFFNNNKATIIKRVLQGIYEGDADVDYYYGIESIADKPDIEVKKIIIKGYFGTKKEAENFMINNVPKGKGRSLTCDVGVLRYQAVGRKKHPKPQFKWLTPYEDLKEIRNIDD